MSDRVPHRIPKRPIAVVVGLIGCARVAAAQATPPGAAPARCAVIITALDSLIRAPRDSVVAVDDSTPELRREDVDRGYWDQLRRTPGVRPSTWADFVARNRRPRLQCASVVGRGRVIFGDSAYAGLPESHDPSAWWRAIRSRFPRLAGIVSTSAPGISRDGRQALMTLSYGCGGRCGHDVVVVLERTDTGRWRVLRTVLGASI